MSKSLAINQVASAKHQSPPQIAALEEALLVGHQEDEVSPEPPSSTDDDDSAPPPAVSGMLPSPSTLQLDPTPLAIDAADDTEAPVWADRPVSTLIAAPVVARRTAQPSSMPAASTVDGVDIGVLRGVTGWGPRTAHPALRSRRVPPSAMGALRLRCGGVPLGMRV